MWCPLDEARPFDLGRRRRFTSNPSRRLRLVLDPGPISLITGKHPSAEQASVDLRCEAVVLGPRFDPIRGPLRPFHLSVYRNLHSSDQLTHYTLWIGSVRPAAPVVFLLQATRAVREWLRLRARLKSSSM